MAAPKTGRYVDKGPHYSHALHNAAEERKVKFVEAIRRGLNITQAAAEAGVKPRTYEAWRERDREFCARIDVARAEHRSEIDKPLTNFERGSVGWIGRFIEWRKRWPGHDTPWFQAELMSLLHEAVPGDIILVLFPPEHGKTRLFEDYATMTISENPKWMSHVGSESQALSKKILGTVMKRLDPVPGSPWKAFARNYGPFAPQRRLDGGHRQAWTATHFDVFKKGEFDDRDYTMAALGFGSQIIGSRSLHLHCDDLQSMKTLGQTEAYMREWRQDWLSRPGQTGFTTVFGNRVDEGDIYEYMIEELPAEVLRVIRYPAIVERNGQVESLWPERWPMEKLERAKATVGAATWERNWMQRPRASKLKTFTDDITGKALNPNLSMLDPLADDRTRRPPAYMALDPSIGGRTCISTWALIGTGMRLVWAREEIGLTSNQAIAQACREGLFHSQAHGYQVTDLVIETMAFQKGLMADVAFEELRDRFGVALRPHMTGLNKLDTNIGIPSVVTSFLKDEVTIPYAADELTRLYGDMLLAELHSWRPMKRGTELIQDLLMTMWFAWLLWRQRRGADVSSSRSPEAFRTAGLPLGITETGLIVPEGAYASIMTGVRR